MGVTSYYASGTTPNPSNTKKVLYQKLAAKVSNGGRNNPLPQNTKRQLMEKIARSLAGKT